MDEAFVRVAPSADVTRRLLRVEINRVSVLVTRLSDGTPVALGATCPHRSLPLDEGTLWDDVIDCPHHHYTYDARTGANVYPSNVFPAERAASIRGLPVYRVREEHGWVWVSGEPV